MWSQPAVLGQLATCAIVGVVAVLAGISALRISSRGLPLVEAFLGGYFLRVALVLVNEYYLIFEHKVAGERSVEFYQKCIIGDAGLIELFRDQFALQVLINTPFFAIFGPNLLTVTVTNCFFGALAGPLVSILLRHAFNERIAKRSLLLFFVYPASVNFSMFGLRDPLIFFSMALFAACSIAVYAGRANKFYIASAIVFCASTLVLRPELSYVIVVLVAMLTFPWTVRRVSAEQRLIEKLAVMCVMLVFALGAVSALGLVSLKIAAMQIGSESINLLEIADDRAEERFARAEQTGFGGGTHLVAAEDYQNMPVYARVFVQTAGLIILPFPWQIDGVAQLLALGDSIFLMLIMLATVIVVIKNPRGGPICSALLVAYCIGLLGMGFIVSNAGNGFRMRYGIVPLILISASFSRSIPVYSRRDDG